MRKVDDGEEKKEKMKKKKMAFLVATTSLPAVYRPNGYARTTTAGTPHARAKRKDKIKVQEFKQVTKKRKQNVKDMKKKMRKQNSQKNNVKLTTKKIPNLKPVPSNCVHLVNKGDLIYEVPGNGACGPNAISAHLFKDEVFGAKLKRNMNIFLAKHWERKYKHKTACSKNNPFERKLGGGGKKLSLSPKN